MVAGKVIVVTGGLGALGQAVAGEAARRGAKVAILDNAPAAAAGDAFVQGGVDLTNADAAVAALNAVKARLGGVDAVLNIAGGFRWQTLEAGDDATWAFLFRINVLTAANTAKAALPHLIERKGAIVNVSAFAAGRAGAGMGAYGASKAGVAKLTEALAAEMLGRVRVNAVLPTIIDTAANRKDMPDADYATWVTPLELATVMLFLASDEASAVTGALIPVIGRVA